MVRRRCRCATVSPEIGLSTALRFARDDHARCASLGVTWVVVEEMGIVEFGWGGEPLCACRERREHGGGLKEEIAGWWENGDRRRIVRRDDPPVEPGG